MKRGNNFTDNWQEIVQQIKSKGMRPGVALKPGTPIEEVYPLVCMISTFSLLFDFLCAEWRNHGHGKSY